MSTETAYELFQKGMSLLESGNPAQAAVVLKRAGRQEPDKTSIREALGRACFNSGNYREACDQFRHVIEHYPTNSYAHYCLARSAEKLGDELLSRRHFRLASVMGYDADSSQIR